jgi:periplasmic protein TonB
VAAAPEPEQSSTPEPIAQQPPASMEATEPAHAVARDLAKPAPAAPLRVKTGSTPTGATPETERAPAPSVLVAAGGSDKAIAGIVGSTKVDIPKQTTQTLSISQGVSQGLLEKRVKPVYPSQAREMHIAGQVLLDAVIAKDGRVVKVQQRSGNPTLGRAALDAVHQWKYRPYLLNGQPVEIETQILVNFELPGN